MKEILIISILLFALAVAEMLFYKPNLELILINETARADSLQQRLDELEGILEPLPMDGVMFYFNAETNQKLLDWKEGK